MGQESRLGRLEAKRLRQGGGGGPSYRAGIIITSTVFIGGASHKLMPSRQDLHETRIAASAFLEKLMAVGFMRSREGGRGGCRQTCCYLGWQGLGKRDDPRKGRRTAYR